jgi:hypothetical protein
LPPVHVCSAVYGGWLSLGLNGVPHKDFFPAALQHFARDEFIGPLYETSILEENGAELPHEGLAGLLVLRTLAEDPSLVGQRQSVVKYKPSHIADGNASHKPEDDFGCKVAEICVGLITDDGSGVA